MSRQRRAEKKALQQVASDQFQPDQLLGRLNALGDHFVTQFVSQVEDGANDDPSVGVAVDPGSERAIDLDVIERQELE